MAVAYLTSPEWITCEDLPIEIQTLPDDIRPGEEKPYLIVSSELNSPKRVKYCHTASDEFVPDLVRRLLNR